MEVVTMPTVSTNGIEMYYERKGSGEPLLLVPGLLFGAEHWRPQADALASDYDVIAVDLRGQYHTTTTDDQADYDMWNQAEDVYGLIQALGIAPTHYAGLSMGGFIGMRLALRHPEVLRSLVLIDTQAHAEDEDRRTQYAAFRELYLDGVIEPLRPVLPLSFFTDDYIANHQGKVDAWFNTLLAGNHEGTAHASLGCDERDDITHRLGEIHLPALVAHGTEDVPIPMERGEQLASRIAGANFVPIEGAAHQSNVSHPDEVSALIADFLAEVRQAAPAGKVR
jgi:pimeloyl-ACP methyl ester carboxylesterase